MSEYTRPEPGNEDHGVREDDSSFSVQIDGIATSVVGGSLSTLGLMRGEDGLTQALECTGVLAAPRESSM